MNCKLQALYVFKRFVALCLRQTLLGTAREEPPYKLLQEAAFVQLFYLSW